jgi:DivIVA domain-containing protein
MNIKNNKTNSIKKRQANTPHPKKRQNLITTGQIPPRLISKQLNMLSLHKNNRAKPQVECCICCGEKHKHKHTKKYIKKVVDLAFDTTNVWSKNESNIDRLCEQILYKKFSKTKWFKGYDMDDVDDYLDDLICKIRQLFNERTQK